MEENYELAKWLAGEMTEKELIAFQSTPEYATYAKIATYSSQLKAPDFDEELLRQNVVHQKKKESPKVVPLNLNWVFRVAAIFVVGLGLFFGYQNFAPKTEYAENGQQHTFALPDNSQVVLNSGSEIQYKKWHWDSNRTLELHGEAYFRVAKGKKFEVNTPLGKVTVLGTQFNVKQRNHRFDVTCYEGRVKVNYNDTEVIITKGMSVAFEDGKSIVIPEKIIQKPEWLNNELAFQQETLPSIISELERHFNVTLELQSNTNTQLFTGILPAENIDLSLQVLSVTYHLQPVKVSKTRIILKSVDVQK